MPLSENDLSGVYTGDVLSASGEKIGAVGQIYLDDQSGEPTFVTANTGLFGMSQSFVPLRGARDDNGNVVVDFDKTTVKDAPRIDDDGSLSPAEEDQLYAYYGMSTGAADTADYGTVDQTPQPGYASADRETAVVGGPRSGDGTDDSGAHLSPGDRELRSQDWGDRPDRADERTAVAGTTSDDDRFDREGSGGRGTFGDARESGDDKTSPDAPAADRDRGRLSRDGDRDSDVGTSPVADGAAGTARGDQSAVPSRGGRLRKLVVTEYEPVKREEVYVEGQGHPGERPTS